MKTGRLIKVLLTIGILLSIVGASHAAPALRTMAPEKCNLMVINNLVGVPITLQPSNITVPAKAHRIIMADCDAIADLQRSAGGSVQLTGSRFGKQFQLVVNPAPATASSLSATMKAKTMTGTGKYSRLIVVIPAKS